MSNELKKLMKQKEALAEKIKLAEQMEKNRNRVERIVLKVVGKHPELYTSEPSELEKALETAIAEWLKNSGSKITD